VRKWVVTIKVRGQGRAALATIRVDAETRGEAEEQAVRQFTNMVLVKAVVADGDPEPEGGSDRVMHRTPVRRDSELGAALKAGNLTDARTERSLLGPGA
jgi:hypothetical protein